MQFQWHANRESSFARVRHSSSTACTDSADDFCIDFHPEANRWPNSLQIHPLVPRVRSATNYLSAHPATIGLASCGKDDTLPLEDGSLESPRLVSSDWSWPHTPSLSLNQIKNSFDQGFLLLEQSWFGNIVFFSFFRVSFPILFRPMMVVGCKESSRLVEDYINVEVRSMKDIILWNSTYYTGKVKIQWYTRYTPQRHGIYSRTLEDHMLRKLKVDWKYIKRAGIRINRDEKHGPVCR